MKRALLTFFAAGATLAVPALAVFAAGPFDGVWQLTAQPAGQTNPALPSEVSGCEGWRLDFTVKDNQIETSLARSYYGESVTEGGPRATPVMGTIDPDGSFTATWQNISATGKITGDKVQARWESSCGPRVATGGRVAASGSSNQ